MKRLSILALITMFVLINTYAHSISQANNYKLDKTSLYIDNVDVGVYNIINPNLIKIGDDVTVQATVKNVGSLSTPLNITVDFIFEGVSQASSTLTIDNLKVEADSTVIFPEWTTIDSPIDVTLLEGLIDIQVYTSATDDTNSDNDTLHSEMKIINGVDRNLVIIEDFTGTWCTYCPGAQMGIGDLKHNGYRVAAIANHISDDYSIDATSKRYTYYGITGLPTAQFDGIITSTGGSHDESLYEIYKPFIEQRMATITTIKLNIENYSYNSETRIVIADAVVERTIDSASDKLVLHSVVVESNIEEEWMDQTELNDVARAYYPNASGTTIDLSTNAKQVIPISFTLNEDWIPEFMELVVFVQDTETKEILNGDIKDINEPSGMASITVSVIDTKSIPVEGATVYLDAITKTTDITGKVIFTDVESGNHTYHVVDENYLPVDPVDIVVGFDDKEYTQEVWKIEFVFEENFDESKIPNGWLISDYESNWSFNNTNTAGGEPHEAVMQYAPDFTGKSALISPNIAIKELVTDKDELYLMFKYSVDDYIKRKGYTIRVRMVSQSNSDTTQYLIIDPKDNIIEAQEKYRIEYTDITEDTLRFEFEFDGLAKNINNWSVDDVWLVKVNNTIDDIDNGTAILQSLNVYPNPAQNELHVADCVSGELNIYSITGKFLIKNKNYDSNQPINVSRLEKGMYIISVKNENSFYSTKVNIIR